MTRCWIAAAALLGWLGAGSVQPASAQNREADATAVCASLHEGEGPADFPLDGALLEERADEVLRVNLCGRPLEQAKRLLGLRKNVTASVRGLLSGLTAVYRRTYRFRRAQASPDDLEPVHSQLAEDGWVPLIEQVDREKPESLAVYSRHQDQEMTGMTVVASDAGEVTVVKILGTLDLEALSAIGSGLGLPTMNLALRGVGQQGNGP